MAKTKVSTAKTAKTSKKDLVRPSLAQVQDEIKARAHEIYLQRSSAGKAGDELSDWLKAEEDIKKKYKL